MINEPFMQRAFSLIRDKGEARLLEEQLKQERGSVEQQMADLVEKFKSTFRPPWKSHLTIQRLAKGRVYVRWRSQGVNGRGQTHFELFDSERGLEILRQQSYEVSSAFVDFEKKRLELNFAHSSLNQMLIRMRQHVVQMSKAIEYQNQIEAAQTEVYPQQVLSR